MKVFKEVTQQNAEGSNEKVLNLDELKLRIAREKDNDANCERTDVINKILEGVNAKLEAGRLPASWAQINGQVRGLPLHELYRLHRDCQNARSYGAMFWYKAKQRRLAPVDKPVAPNPRGAKM